jgi:hypothetical protein
LIYFYCLSVITILARPPSEMIAKTAFIAIGGPPKYTNYINTYKRTII